MNTDKLPPKAFRAFVAAIQECGAHHLLQGAPDKPMELAGLVPSDDDPKDYPYVPTMRPPLNEMDFRSQCPPIRDQGQVGACTAFHVDSHCGRFAKIGGRADTAFSARANYAMSRQLMGLTGDSGASLRAAIHAAYKYGIPTEAQFPYGTDWQAIIDTTTLPEAVMAEAAQNKIDSYYRIDHLPAEEIADNLILNRRIDHVLADGGTVGIGIFLFRWFYFVKGPLSTHPQLRSNPNPALLKPGQQWSDIIGAHAMVIVGRSDALGGYIVRNQWNTTWGDAGYYLMPFSDTQFAFEFWAVFGFDGDDIALKPYDVTCAEAQAARLYRCALGRYADAGGLAFHTDVVNRYGVVTDAQGFLQSPEYQRLYGAAQTDEAFVTALYKNALRRDPDPSGFQFHVNALKAGRTHAEMLVDFSESPESRALL
jgi:hypothetical protein